MQDNLEWRSRLIQAAEKDMSLRADLYDACAQGADGLLFFVNTFGWTYDPRKTLAPYLPFVTWEYQDDAFCQINAAIDDGEDVLVEKSRDMGASWICLTVMEWRWQFLAGQTFMMVSRNEDLVDKRHEPDSLFWKIDFLLRCQPLWLMPDFERQKLSLVNTENGSTITGSSTTSETSRGGRKTAMLLDEFASVPDGYGMLRSSRDNTNCRIFNSTPQGTGNAFYDLSQKNIRKLRMHWTLHPEKALGLYRDEQGRPRSPWYDKQCERAAHPTEIAQELDIDYLGSDFVFFDPPAIAEHKALYCLPPFRKCRIELDSAKAEITALTDDEEKGDCLLWTNLDIHGRPEKTRRYTAAADISTGSGASNSCLSIFDEQSREKVLEFATPHIEAHEFAIICVALCKLFNNAGLIWDARGPGASYSKRVLELGYTNIWYRRREDAVTKKTTDTPGFYATKESKRVLLESYRAALKHANIINRSSRALSECLEYIHSADGSIEHNRERGKIDPTGARDNHGDRVIADALAWHRMKELEQSSRCEEAEQDKPLSGFALRRQKAARMAQQDAYLWA